MIRLAVAARRLQSWLIGAIRRSRAFPRSITDKLGEDEAMAGQRLSETVMVYFPGPPNILYQIVPWLSSFEHLSAVHPVVIVCADSRVAEHLRSRTSVRVITIGRYGALDGLLGRSDVKLALYVSQVNANFDSLRFASLMHIHIGHGDSDKGVSASNQLKAYDYVFVPGPAAVERMRVRLMNFDVDTRCLVVGQPQFRPSAAIADAARGAAGRRTVLYAPTWEGAQPSVAYSSLQSHGLALVESLLADGRFAVEYRPHPLTGVTSPLYSKASSEIATAVERARQHTPDAGHRVIKAEEESLEESFARADLLVCDVSAVSTAWLPTLRPVVVTIPPGDQFQAADGGLLAALPRLAAKDAAQAHDLLWSMASDDTGRESRRRLIEHYLEVEPDRTPAARFIEACSTVIRIRDEQWNRMLASGGGGV